jgi:DNA polymerase-3 subunit epsilon
MVAIDVETTGLDPARDEIVSIGLLPMTLKCIASSASRYWVVRPRIDLNPESVVIHAITHAQIEAAPDLGAVIDELLAALAGRVVVVHCRDIERSFLDRALKARIGEGVEFPVIDTMDLEARIHRAARPGFFARLFGRKPAPVSIRLADSRTRYHLPRYRAHHALTDALATAELLQAQMAHRFAPETPLRELWR